jgi:hypothetical protein
MEWLTQEIPVFLVYINMSTPMILNWSPVNRLNTTLQYTKRMFTGHSNFSLISVASKMQTFASFGSNISKHFDIRSRRGDDVVTLDQKRKKNAIKSLTLNCNQSNCNRKMWITGCRDWKQENDNHLKIEFSIASTVKETILSPQNNLKLQFV